MIQNAISKSLSKNSLGLFADNGDVQVDKLADVLEIAKAQLAEALNLSGDQVRQARLTGKAKDRLEQLATALEYVSETFDGDLKTTIFWLKTPNQNFGGFSPRQLILKGKYKKVLEFILAARVDD
ncbi:MAG: hypothetical protein KF789_05635 [Bdellovibrionaceae bacterium]|nr:hypothetical protein [Pseudobdellovibrionaceae bacterium]